MTPFLCADPWIRALTLAEFKVPHERQFIKFLLEDILRRAMRAVRLTPTFRLLPDLLSQLTRYGLRLVFLNPAMRVCDRLYDSSSGWFFVRACDCCLMPSLRFSAVVSVKFYSTSSSQRVRRAAARLHYSLVILIGRCSNPASSSLDCAHSERAPAARRLL